MSEQPERLRVHPRERFAASELRFNLAEAFERLKEESVARQGHIQKTLYHHGPTTLAIFAFEAGAAMDQHAVDGEAILHVLNGRLTVTTEDATHDLRAGSVLLLDPGVPHDVHAKEPTHLMLTVVLHRDD